jgi:recombination protein RecA
VAQAGGFGVVALDLCDIPAFVLRQVPSSTWLRLHLAVEGRETMLVLLAAEPITRSAGGVSVRIQGRPLWEGDTGRSCRLAGMDCAMRVVSSRASSGTREVQVALAG